MSSRAQYEPFILGARKKRGQMGGVVHFGKKFGYTPTPLAPGLEGRGPWTQESPVFTHSSHTYIVGLSELDLVKAAAFLRHRFLLDEKSTSLSQVTSVM